MTREDLAMLTLGGMLILIVLWAGGVFYQIVGTRVYETEKYKSRKDIYKAIILTILPITLYYHSFRDFIDLYNKLGKKK